MAINKHEVFSIKKARRLTRWVRRILQNPNKILRPYVRSGMNVLDFGCGPGFFTIEAAKLAGEEGRVIAVDLQQGMLDLLADKIKGSELEKRIILRKCEDNKIGVTEGVDVFLAIHVVHEVPDKALFFMAVKNILKPKGIFYVSEPKGRVDKAEFEEMIMIAKKNGFKIKDQPKIYLDRAIVMSHDGA